MNEKIKHQMETCARKLTNKNSLIKKTDLLVEAMLSAEKNIVLLEEIKKTVAGLNSIYTIEIGKLLLICSRLEMINKDLTEFKREYNL